MTEYYIRTSRGEEGPFSKEELRIKAINSETLVCSDGASWTPAGEIVALQSLFPDAVRKLNIKKPASKHLIGSDSNNTDNKTRSKISLLQWAAIVLLALNGLIYYYKGEPATVKIEKVSVTVPTEEPEMIAVKTAQPIQKPVAENSDTLHRIRNNWPDYIKARHNDFKFYTKLGGIRRLEAIVQNQTDYPLDTVKVAVKYIRRGETFKTEYVTFYNVPGQGEVSVPAPNSRSGTSVILDITEVASGKMHFYYNSGIAAEGKEDPFFKM